MAGIDDWDRVALPALSENGGASASELVRRVGIDQFDGAMAKAWIRDAESRGLIRKVKGSSGSPRYALTDKGRARIG
jgi:DNA-binding MarR family transcriptional regulator